MTRALKGLPVRAALLTSRVPAKERKKILEAAATGEIDVVVGTHALLEGDVRFARLRLAVIDEQHRFGVRQRATLRQKSQLIDLLVMTATPIPRTLALALYGDLDASTLDEMPPGRERARTFLSSEARALGAVRTAATQGRQAFVVYPVIEDSGNLEIQSAKTEFKRLGQTALAGLRLGLIHGALAGKQKAQVMQDFAQGKLDALIATQVIEVGIDVPNATVMVVQNADRFGLASLHQLRGRIGRGQAPAECHLVGEPKSEQARQRLEIMTATHDGFKIGEEDLKLRGPGEFLGTAQHGELSLRVADLTRDAELLGWARQDAEELLAADEKLLSSRNAALRERLIALYQRQWDWIDLA
jgi:ATP-dependent DNA helicase RecG